MNGRRRLRAMAALVTTILLVVGVPVVLIVFVGNPWPGRTTLELGDEVALVVGVLAVLAWLVWLRFAAAVVVEVRAQVAELRGPPRPARFPAPPPARHGVGLLAQRLVAAALIVLPIAPRVTTAVAHGPDDARRAPVTLVSTQISPSAPAVSATPIGGHVTVVAGDTLFGLARAHLGDTERWREIFELNRDRPQSDGGRLTSPSIIRAGWTLALPADATGFLAPETVTIEDGDNLWSLSHDRLERAGAAHDDTAVAGYVQSVVAANPDVVEDPDLIFPGEQFDFPAIGTPPPPPPPPPPTPPPPPPVAEPPADVTVPEPERPIGAPLPAPAVASSTTAPVAPPIAPPATAPAPADRGAPSPVGVGEAALLSAGVLALLASRRRARLRAARPRARVPEPPAGAIAAERRLRTIDAGERLARVDVGIRAAAATLVATSARIAVVRAAIGGDVELTLTGDVALPQPWQGAGRTWCFPGHLPVELLADVARTVGAPCVALTQLGVDADGGEVLADLEALGVLGIDAPAPLADAVVRGVAATLATSVFAESANLVGVGIDESTFLDHRRAHVVDTVDGALELAATLIGTTATAPQSTFVLRARHTSGEAWEPAVVLVGSDAAGELDADAVHAACRSRGGVAVVAAGDAPGAPWRLRIDDARWVLEPSGLVLSPVGLSTGDVAELQVVLDEASRATGRRRAGAHRRRGCAVDADGPSDRSRRGRRRAWSDGGVRTVQGTRADRLVGVAPRSLDEGRARARRCGSSTSATPRSPTWCPRRADRWPACRRRLTARSGSAGR